MESHFPQYSSLYDFFYDDDNHYVDNLYGNAPMSTLKTTPNKGYVCDGDKTCVCQMMEANLVVPTYITKECWTRRNLTKLVNEVCPVRDQYGQKICHLHGCDNTIASYWHSEWMPTVAVFGIIFIVMFLAGLIFILQITHNFRNKSWRIDTKQVCILGPAKHQVYY